MLLVVPALGRIGRRVRLGTEGDVPMRLLALTVAGLSEHHREWAGAMSAELAAVSGAGPRWRFSVGCARAAGVIRARAALTSRQDGGASLRAVVGAGLIAAMALAGYGLVRYPGLRSADGARLTAVMFVGLLLAFGAATQAFSRGTGASAAAGRRFGVLGGVTIGAAWLVVSRRPAC